MNYEEIDIELMYLDDVKYRYDKLVQAIKDAKDDSYKKYKENPKNDYIRGIHDILTLLYKFYI